MACSIREYGTAEGRRLLTGRLPPPPWPPTPALAVPELRARPAGPARAAARPGWRTLPLGAVVGVTVLTVMALGGLWPGIDPYSMDVSRRLAGPSPAHWLGTDRLGRDLLARSLVASRYSLALALSSSAVAAVVGTALGLAAGRGGALEEALSRLVDALMALPGVLSAMLLAVVLGPSPLTVGLAIAVALVPGYFRVSRGLAIALREAPYVEAAYAAGATWAHVARRHLLPAMARPLAAHSAAAAAVALLADAGLSYLGLGMQPPTPSWGLLLKEAQQAIGLSPWPAAVPGFFLAAAALSFNAIASALQRGGR